MDGADPVRATISLLFLSAIFFLSCDQDPFHLRERPVLAGYELQQWEDDKTYYLIKSGENDNGGGVIDGTITRIGWNGRYIVAERKATFGGDKDGWMIIDTSTGGTSGPLSNAEFRARPEVRNIAILTPQQAWQRLHRSKPL
jgi:hypothetical protein